MDDYIYNIGAGISNDPRSMFRIQAHVRRTHGVGGVSEGIPLAAIFSSYSFHRLGMIYGDLRLQVKSYVFTSPFCAPRKTYKPSKQVRMANVVRASSGKSTNMAM